MKLFRVCLALVTFSAAPAFAQLVLEERLLWDQRLFEMESVEDRDRPLQFSVYGGFKHDSNLFRLSPDADPQITIGSSDKSDNIYQLGAGAKLELRKSRQKLTVEGNAEQNWFQNFDNLDNTANGLRGEWAWQVGNDWSGTLGARHRHYLESFTDVQANIRDMIDRDRAYGSANYRPLSYLKFTVDVDWTRSEHEAAVRQVLDYRANSSAFTVSWVTPAENTLGVRFRTADTRFPNQGSGLASNEYDENEYSLVGTWRASGASLFRGRLGHTQRQFAQDASRDFSGPTWRIGYEWEPTGKTALELAAWRELYGFEDLSGSYVRTTGIGFFPAWSVMPKLILQGKALYQTRDYFGDPAATPITGAREDDERLVQLAAIWTPLRLTKLILAVEAGDRDSNQALADYEYHSVSFGVMRTF